MKYHRLNLVKNAKVYYKYMKLFNKNIYLIYGHRYDNIDLEKSTVQFPKSLLKKVKNI